MNRLPPIFGKFTTHLWYILLTPAFFLVFFFIYKPFGSLEALDMGRGLFFFNVTIMMCILLVIMAIMHLAFYLLYRHMSQSLWQLIGWIDLEITVTTFFFAMYICLMGGSKVPYFEEVAICLQYTFLTLFYPFFGITMICLLVHMERREIPTEQPGESVRFQDASGKVRIVLAKDAILFVKAEENYVKVHYLDNDRVKDYQLRTSMTAIAPLMEKHGMFRCQRSYYINPRHIVALRKDANELISAEIKATGLSIPVSRKVYQELSARL